MGKTILTPKQSQFLEYVSKDEQITRSFYLTGGTALSEFYLHHRISYDIDLFTEKQEVDQKLIEAFLKKISKDLTVVEVKRSQMMGLISYILIFDNQQKLKVDFNYYPFPRIEKGTCFKNLEVDSVYDIAANKLHTIFMQPRSRDYLDLYVIMQRYNYSLNQLILAAKAKFDWHIDRITLASQFIKATDFDESSIMIIPFDKKSMDTFFLSLAKSLKEEIFK
ncbi:MAG TPA: nucleotidyl transferase AbiEii/AbiGii toxin family protein [Patescibacteria group bacterium]|nr:nucleotidyl transferase AbiEii/AbiGii toxin family protein [Patescibacteria group bacterium]